MCTEMQLDSEKLPLLPPPPFSSSLPWEWHRRGNSAGASPWPPETSCVVTLPQGNMRRRLLTPNNSPVLCVALVSLHSIQKELSAGIVRKLSLGAPGIQLQCIEIFSRYFESSIFKVLKVPTRANSRQCRGVAPTLAARRSAAECGASISAACGSPPVSSLRPTLRPAQYRRGRPWRYSLLGS